MRLGEVDIAPHFMVMDDRTRRVDELQADAWRDLFARLDRETQLLQGTRTAHVRGMLAGIELVRQCMLAREAAIRGELERESGTPPHPTS